MSHDFSGVPQAVSMPLLFPKCTALESSLTTPRASLSQDGYQSLESSFIEHASMQKANSRHM